ncbi:hypothetical protein GW17_00057143, partial [Ensete ventricosum]
ALARDGRQRLARKRLPTVHPQGAAASGQPTRGSPWRARKGLPPAGATAPVARVVRNAQRRRLRRGSDGSAGG